jgi:hypothetical protein
VTEVSLARCAQDAEFTENIFKIKHIIFNAIYRLLKPWAVGVIQSTLSLLIDFYLIHISAVSAAL